MIRSSNGVLTTTDRTPVYIGGFFSFGGSWESKDILPAVEMALDHVNQDDRILPDYKLVMNYSDTQVRRWFLCVCMFFKCFIGGWGCSLAFSMDVP